MKPSDSIQILIVEDDQNDLDLTLHALRKANLANHIQVARDGEEALDFIFLRGVDAGRSVENGPKVVLLDLKLPKVDGMEVLTRMKSDPRTRSIPVVILTSSNEQRDVFKGFDLGANSYIVKPVNFERFAAAIQDLGMYWLILNRSPNTEG